MTQKNGWNTPVIENRKARYEYFVEEELECGLVLKGNEVKSIREGQCNIKESWVQVQDGELVLRGMHITKWHTSNLFDVDEDRERVLLAHKKEIKRLSDHIKQDGYTLIPLKLYFSNGRAKVLVGLCKGKHNYDKRNTIKEREVKRKLERQSYE